MSDHSNDQIVFAQYPDATERLTYPPAPQRGGNPNKEATDAVTAVVNSRHVEAVRNEAAFRERQRQRRLVTRGAAAMREPEDVTSSPVRPSLPNDPDLDPYTAAGWLG